MKQKVTLTSLTSLLFCVVIFAFISSCSPSIELTGTWNDQNSTGKKLNKIAVMAIGKNLSNRQLAENKLVSELTKRGFTAVSSLTFLPPDFQQLDTMAIGGALQRNNVDGLITVRVVSKSESQRYVPGTTYAGGYGYPGYYGHWGGYYSSYGYYSSPGYTVTDVEVLLETNLYDLSTGHLLWIGQSKAFTGTATDLIVTKYAVDVVNDIVTKKVIVP
jgi:hypothetical protein